MTTKKWKSEPISATCEVIIKVYPLTFCGKPTTKAYPCEPTGYMTLCREHGYMHKEAWPIQEIDEVLI